MSLPESVAPPVWLPSGEEPRPLGSITHCVILRHAGLSLVAQPAGEIDASNDSSTGLYYLDARHLSLFRLSLGGVAPILLDSSADEGQSAVFTNPAIRPPDGGAPIAAQTLVIRRSRVLVESLIEELSISNYGAASATIDVRVQFAADFADIFVVRGFERRDPPPPVVSTVETDRVTLVYVGADARQRQTTIAFSPPPGWLSDAEAVFTVSLAPGETYDIALEVAVQRAPGGQPLKAATRHLHEHRAAWLSRATEMVTNHAGVNEALRRSLVDVHALQTRLGEQPYLAAGVPWFDTLFGRDSLIAGMELLACCPDILKNALLVLASFQAETDDAAHDAAPGKIPHELRWGELANTGEVPFGRYYGSVDATPLFVLAAAEYIRWTGDGATLKALRPHLDRAMAWCAAERARDPRGFLTYYRESAHGLENQGWKDSGEAIVWPDGRRVEPPIALVEVQGYFAAALAGYQSLSEVATAASAADMAPFRAALDAAFANDELGYVLALDGAGAPVPTPSSNAGHLLWAGIARPDLAARIAQRLLEPDMFSGWGIRTLGSGVGGYNPLGYHVGSIWPHDNALILAGLRRYGFEEASERLGTGFIEAALRFPDYRVPELFSGDARSLRGVPTPYPVASRPQAWSAASLPSVFASLLGLQPGRPGQLCIVRPVLPREVDWLRVRNLHFADGSVDVMFRRIGRHVGVEIERIDGPIEVVLSDSPQAGRQ